MSRAFPRSDLEMVLARTPEFWVRFAGARVFITGGTGLVGAWLLQTIQHANDSLGAKVKIVSLARNPEAAKNQLPHVFERSDVTLMHGDIRSLRGQVGQLDLCIHAAADVADPNQARNPLDVFDSIVEGTRRVLDFAHGNKASKFLLTSSGAIYGSQPSDLPNVPESYLGAPDPTLPGASYGNSKRTAEWLAGAYAARAADGAFATSIGRIFALMGPGMPLDGRFAAGNFMSDAMAGKTISVNSDGRSVRSYLYMADLCVWLLRILERGVSGRAYNVGSENAISVGTLAERIANASGTNAGVKIVSPVAGNAGPALRYVPDTSLAREELDLAEYTSLDVALSKTISWIGNRQ